MYEAQLKEHGYCLLCTPCNRDCLMQLDEILTSQFPIMFMKEIQIKAQRIPTEGVHMHLFHPFFIKTHSALKFKNDKRWILHQWTKGVLAQETAGKLSWRWDRCSDIQPYVTLCVCLLACVCVTSLKDVSETCRKGQAWMEQQEDVDRWKQRRIGWVDMRSRDTQTECVGTEKRKEKKTEQWNVEFGCLDRFIVYTER